MKEKILIVDDEQMNLEFFQVMLSNLGFEVQVAEDGEEALESVEASPPDLIILDNVMPRMSGWEFTRLLKRDAAYAKYRSIPIIMFSAMDDVKDKIEGFELGVEDYITKPFNFSEVLARIKAVLRSRDLAVQVARREQRLAVIESLNKSLVYFTQHLQGPVNEILAAGNSIDTGNVEAVNAFVRKVNGESKEIIATLEALAEEISELQGKRDKIKAAEISLEGLEKKYQKHFDSQSRPVASSVRPARKSQRQSEDPENER